MGMVMMGSLLGARSVAKNERERGRMREMRTEMLRSLPSLLLVAYDVIFPPVEFVDFVWLIQQHQRCGGVWCDTTTHRKRAYSWWIMSLYCIIISPIPDGSDF